MNQLIQLHAAQIGSETIQTVNARDLHAFLEGKQQFADWIKARVEQYGFVEGQDYLVHKITNNPLGGRPTLNYHLTIDMAKELAMVERNAKGKEARQYFIECERQAKSAALVPANLSRMQLLEMAMQAEQERLALEATVKEQAPKVEFFDQVAAAKNAQPIATIAKIFGLGAQKMFAWLREVGFLMSSNLPYQQYVDAGYFKVIEKSYRDRYGESRIYAQTMVTGKGLTAIQKKRARTNELALSH